MHKYLLALILVLAGCGEGASTFSQPPQATCSATITWEPPTERTDGTPLTTAELKQYTIYVNRRDSVDTSTLVTIYEVSDTNIVTWQLDGLSKGQKYFYMTATDTEGRESTFSNIMSKLCT